MTPQPSKEELAQRSIICPQVGEIHIKDLLGYARDGEGSQDILSDHAIGMLAVAIELGWCQPWEVELYQTAFVEKRGNGRIQRRKKGHFVKLGPAFTLPDGKVLRFQGRDLLGSESLDGRGLAGSVLPYNKHPKFEDWLSEVMYAGCGEDDNEYTPWRGLNSKNEVDTAVNTDKVGNKRPYTPGPLASIHPQVPV